MRDRNLYLIAQRTVRRATLDALNGWALDVVVVSIAVMCPTVSCYVLNIKENHRHRNSIQ